MDDMASGDNSSKMQIMVEIIQFAAKEKFQPHDDRWTGGELKLYQNLKKITQLPPKNCKPLTIHSLRREMKKYSIYFTKATLILHEH